MQPLRKTSRLGLVISLVAALAAARPNPAAATGREASSLALNPRAPSAWSGPALALSGDPQAMEQEVPRMMQVRVHKSNLRRMQWGYALTIVGILGIITGGVGMVVASSTADKDKGPAALADPTLARRYRRQHRAGLAMLFSGLGVGISGMIAGPLLVRSARRRQQALWKEQSSLSRLFPGLRVHMP